MTRIFATPRKTLTLKVDLLPSTTATFAARETSDASKKVPLVTRHDRMAGKSMPVPWMVVDQFWLPATTCACVFT